MKQRWTVIIAMLAGFALFAWSCGGDDNAPATSTRAASTAPVSATTAAGTSTASAGTATPAAGGIDPCTLRMSLEGRALAAGPAFSLAPETRWQFCIGGAAAGSSEKYLFRSADGGTSWTLLSQTTLGTPPAEAGVGQLPNGNAAEALFFIDQDNGWLGLSSPGVNLYRTSDGGVMWTSVSALPSGLPVTAIAFTDAQHGSLTTPDGPWTTSDGGATWTMGP